MAKEEKGGATYAETVVLLRDLREGKKWDEGYRISKAFAASVMFAPATARLFDELAGFAYHVGKYREAFDLNTRLLAIAPPSDVVRLVENREYSLPLIELFQPFRTRHVFVNLERRQDRRDKFRREFAAALCPIVADRFSAFDGRLLRKDDGCAKFFDLKAVPAPAVGAGLSQRKCWEDLTNSKDQARAMYEDDVEFSPKYRRDFVLAMDAVSRIDPDWDILMLGYSVAPGKETAKTEEPPYVEPFDRSKYWGGFFGYVIRKKYAKVLCEALARGPIGLPLDVWWVRNSGSAKAYQCSHSIVFTKCAHDADERKARGESSGDVDSDIQYDKSLVQ